MIALERWIPTVRRDFPNTIPFWVVIKVLPDYHCEAVAMKEIGEDLGEYMELEITKPYPRVRVMLKGDAPLLLKRETDSEGEICLLRFVYEKLHKHCSFYLWLTHEAATCPDRARAYPQLRPHQREPNRRRDEDEDGRQRRGTKEVERRNVVQDKRRRSKTGPMDDAPDSPVARRPVRRDILSVLESSGEKPSRVSALKEFAREWVKKAFEKKNEQGTTMVAELGEEVVVSRETGQASRGHHASSYRSEEEASLVNRVNRERDIWKEADRIRQGKGLRVTAVGTTEERWAKAQDYQGAWGKKEDRAQPF